MEYQGDYACPELPATFSLRLRGGRLIIEPNRASRIFLVPFMPDRFSYGSNRIRFIRDKRRRNIVGFRLDAGRVRNLRFDRSSD